MQKEGAEVDYFLIEGSGLSAYLNAVKPLKQQIREFRPDVVHAHYGLSGIPAVMQGEVPAVVTFHNGETLSRGVNLLTSLVGRKAKYSVIVAQHIYDKLIFKPKNYCILPCGVDLGAMPIYDKEEERRRLRMKEGVKYVLFGGAFDNLRKNYPLLREAIGLIDDYEVEALEMKGYGRDELNRLMCACDVFCLPSKSEGSPQALKEAMACNCPIVATPVADIPYLLGDIEGHYLCGFDARELASALRRAFEFGGRTEGRKRIEELGLDNKKVAEKLLKIYGEVRG